MDDQVIKLTFRTDTASVGTARQAVEGLSNATKAYTSAAKDTRESVRGLTYAFNDFFSASGGIDQRLNAIANNLPQLLVGFGGLGMALSAIVPIIGMVIKNWDTLSETFGIGNAKLPETADLLKRLDEQLKKTGDEIDKYKERTNLAWWEVQEYNKLTEKQIDLERQKREELEKQKELDKLRSMRPEDETKRAAAFQKAIAEGGGYDVAEGVLVESLRKVGTMTGQDWTFEGTAQQGEDLLRAASKGDKSAILTIMNAVRMGNKGPSGTKLREAIYNYSPEVQDEYDAESERFDEEMKARAEARKARDAKAKTAAEAKSRVELDWWDAQADAVSADEEQKAEDRRKAKEAAAAAERARKAEAKPFDDLAQDVARKAMELESRGLDYDSAMTEAFKEIMAAQQALGMRQAAAEAYARQLIGDAARLRTWLGRGGR